MMSTARNLDLVRVFAAYHLDLLDNDLYPNNDEQLKIYFQKFLWGAAL